MSDTGTKQIKSKLVVGDNLSWGQKYADPIRPQKASDNTGMNEKYQLGKLPKGGYQSVWDFSQGSYSTKLSPTSKPEKKVKF
jgi:hypothetical protein